MTHNSIKTNPHNLRIFGTVPNNAPFSPHGKIDKQTKSLYYFLHSGIWRHLVRIRIKYLLFAVKAHPSGYKPPMAGRFSSVAIPVGGGQAQQVEGNAEGDAGQ